MVAMARAHSGPVAFAIFSMLARIDLSSSPACHLRAMKAGLRRGMWHTAYASTGQPSPDASFFCRVVLTFDMHFLPSGVFQNSVKEVEARLAGSKAAWQSPT